MQQAEAGSTGVPGVRVLPRALQTATSAVLGREVEVAVRCHEAGGRTVPESGQHQVA